SILCTPILNQGLLIGLLYLENNIISCAFTPNHLNILRIISYQLAISIENAILYSNLEQKIMQRTALLVEKTRDIQSILQYMRQGIFIIIQNRTIHHEYSNYLEQILETKNIAHQDVSELIFSNTNLSNDQLHQISSFLDLTIGYDKVNFVVNAHILPKEIHKTTPSGKTKILEIDWDPMYGQDKMVDKLMVSVRDVTDIRKLQARAEQQNMELNIISEILNNDLNQFLRFIEGSNYLLMQNEKLIDDDKVITSEEINQILRNIHTIKGNARTLNYRHITNIVHDFEYGILETENKFDDLELSFLLKEGQRLIKEKLYEYKRIFEQKFPMTKPMESSISAEIVEKITSIVVNSGDSDQEKIHALNQITWLVKHKGYESISDIIAPMIKGFEAISIQLGKKPPRFEIKNNNIYFNRKWIGILRDILSHCISNSLDHGIEKPEIRLADGKTESGLISITSIKTPEDVTVEIRDDGIGLNLNRVYEKALKIGAIDKDQSHDDRKIAETIFANGVSTSDAATEISGRGVGMDAVKALLYANSASITITPTGRKTSKGYLPFKLVIWIPSDQCAIFDTDEKTQMNLKSAG
ncbi:MAG: Hpt domain-containing protein, partial [Oligoflexales bacterium]|nr:Hpt domain-containing protein [Oligoflexales bacterium]